MRLKSVLICLAMLALPAAAAAPLPAPRQVEIAEGNITLHAQL
jgi:hypothetical protein